MTHRRSRPGGRLVSASPSRDAAPLSPPSVITELDLDGVRAFDILVPPLRLPPELTPSEAAVVQLLVEGASNADIARARGSRARTVANQLASIFRKLGVNSRAELLARLMGG